MSILKKSALTMLIITLLSFTACGGSSADTSISVKTPSGSASTANDSVEEAVNEVREAIENIDVENFDEQMQQAIEDIKNPSDNSVEGTDEEGTVPLTDAEVGDIVLFGNYEQDNDESKGTESIGWIVLAKEEGKLLLLSEYALTGMPYNDEDTDVTWDTCTLRTWLNSDFFNAAFGNDEQSMILATEIPVDVSHYWNNEEVAGSDTQDNIFILGYTEAEELLTYPDTCLCEVTAYAKEQGAYASRDGCCNWWLRGPGDNPNLRTASNVTVDGSINASGFEVNTDYVGVRPAMWVSIP